MPKYVEKLTKSFAIAKNFIKLHFFNFERQISGCRYFVVDFLQSLHLIVLPFWLFLLILTWHRCVSNIRILLSCGENKFPCSFEYSYLFSPPPQNFYLKSVTKPIMNKIMNLRHLYQARIENLVKNNWNWKAIRRDFSPKNT